MSRFALPEEKRQAIINAGYRVFSENSYKNSPMSEIAEAAGISKSLLFYYFRNKKELFLFLWENCAETTIEFLTRYECYNQKELFESMERGMRVTFGDGVFWHSIDRKTPSPWLRSILLLHHLRLELREGQMVLEE